MCECFFLCPETTKRQALIRHYFVRTLTVTNAVVEGKVQQSLSLLAYDKTLAGILLTRIWALCS